jgi:long-chain acyl-CoA synthetase
VNANGIATTGDLIRVQAVKFGLRPVLTFDGRTWTWAELDERSSQVAQALLAEGVEPQDRVGFLGRNCAEHFEVLFATAKLNAVLVPVNWRLAPGEVAYIVDHAHAKVLIVGPEFVDVVNEIRSQLPALSTVIVLGDEYEAWVESRKADDPQVAADGSDVALQMYTSGTTGLPKGVMLSNENLWSIVPITRAWGITTDSVSLVCMPLFHMAGTGWSLPGMYQGCHIVLLREPDPAAILDAIPRYQVSEALLVPAVMQFMLQMPGCKDTDFSSLRTIFYGGSPISNDTLVDAIQTFRCGFVQLYGLTESTGLCTYLPASDHEPSRATSSRLRSCGITPAGIELRVVDPETGGEVTTGEMGEIQVRSRGVMKGYWNDAEATADTITPEGWLCTGDAGYVDEDGYLYLCDRVKDMIVSGAENVYPAEVENVLYSHPAIVDAAVIGIPDERWGETVKAIVVLGPGATLAPGELIAWTRDRLAHYKCPTSIDFVDALPRNASGKVLKRDLREPYWRGRQRRVH